MTLLELTSAINRLGLVISFMSDGRLAVGPKAKLNPEIRQAISNHKDDLRGLFPPRRPGSFCPYCRQWNLWEGTTGIWCVDCERRAFLFLDDDGLVRADCVGTEEIDLPHVCAKCQGVELWESVTGIWRCLRCDPPAKAQLMRKRAAYLRRREKDVSEKSVLDV